jgi:hypothetical protein
MPEELSPAIPVGTRVRLEGGDIQEGIGIVSEAQPDRCLIRFPTGNETWAASDRVRAAGAGGVGVAATVMACLTLLLGGSWWVLMYVYVITHGGTKNLDELLLPITAVMTCVVFLLPTMVLTRMARSRGGGKLRFNRTVLALVGTLMVWTIVYGIFGEELGLRE